MKKSKLGLALAAVYLAVVAAALIYAVYLFKFDVGNSELAGVPVIVLTLPWSMMIVSAFNSMPGNSLALGFAVLVFSALVNAAILYLIGALTGRAFGSGKRA